MQPMPEHSKRDTVKPRKPSNHWTHFFIYFWPRSRYKIIYVNQWLTIHIPLAMKLIRIKGFKVTIGDMKTDIKCTKRNIYHVSEKISITSWTCHLFIAISWIKYIGGEGFLIMIYSLLLKLYLYLLLEKSTQAS